MARLHQMLKTIIASGAILASLVAVNGGIYTETVEAAVSSSLLRGGRRTAFRVAGKEFPRQLTNEGSDTIEVAEMAFEESGEDLADGGSRLLLQQTGAGTGLCCGTNLTLIGNRCYGSCNPTQFVDKGGVMCVPKPGVKAWAYPKYTTAAFRC